MAEFDIDSLKKDSTENKIKSLRQLKHQLIGFTDWKEEYFNKGIIEVLMPMLGKEQDYRLLVEIIAIINSYFFDFPKAYECFLFYKSTFVQIHFFLQSYKDT